MMSPWLPLTCVNTWCFSSSGITNICANSPSWAAWTIFHATFILRLRGSWNSIPIMQPLPRASINTSCRAFNPLTASRSFWPCVALRSTSFSSSKMCSVAKPTAMPRLLRPKLEEWTQQRSIRLNTF